ERRRRQVHERVAPLGESRPEERREGRHAAPVLAEVAPAADTSHRGRDGVVGIVAMVVRLAQHEVVRLGVERAMVGLTEAGPGPPELGGVLSTVRVSHTELVGRIYVVVGVLILNNTPPVVVTD